MATQIDYLCCCCKRIGYGFCNQPLLFSELSYDFSYTGHFENCFRP